MTRKDYILIAECLNSARQLACISTNSEHRDGPLAVKRAAEFLASLLARGNPRFDRERFLKACGVQS